MSIRQYFYCHFLLRRSLLSAIEFTNEDLYSLTHTFSVNID